MEEFPFRIDFDVRDYECDLQGVVNNAVYQNYLEHCRHEFLKSRGLDFAQLTEKGLHLVVVRAELDYRGSLKSGDSFTVALRMERFSRVRFVFFQNIYRKADAKLMVKGVIFGTCVNDRGRPSWPEEIMGLLVEQS